MRRSKWDYAKLFLILCVIIGHVTNYNYQEEYLADVLQYWVYMFHMPAFIFVAGLFSKKTVEEKRYHKFVPYIFIYVLMQGMDYFCNIIIEGPTGFGQNFFKTNGVAWYALAMVWFYLVTILGRRVKPSYVLTMALLVALLSGYSKNIGSFLVLQRSVIFYPFFYLGYIMDLEKLSQFLDKLWVKLLSVCILVISFGAAWYGKGHFPYWRKLFRGCFHYMEIGWRTSYVPAGLYRLLWMLGALVIFMAIFSLMPSKDTPIAAMGRRTLPVFVFHMYAIKLLLEKWNKPMEWMMKNFTLHSILFSILLLVVFSLPIFEWLVKKIMIVPARDAKERKCVD